MLQDFNGTPPIIDRLLATTEIQPWQRGKVYLQLAEKFDHLEDYIVSDSYIAMAEDQFQISHYERGELHAQLIRLLRPNEDPRPPLPSFSPSLNVIRK